MASEVFELIGKIKIDKSEFEKGLSSAKSSVSKFATGVKKVLSTVAKASVAMGGASAAGVIALVKQSASAYGEYEQLVGGVKKLYGNMGMTLEEYAESVGKSTDQVKSEWQKLEKAQTIVLNNAKNAFKNSGMSMSAYMDTATQFSASLISSLKGDTVEAAKLTDVAMRSISDNWNTFGGDLDSIVNAYKGFSKQNYTMLDNLKLGYGGTKQEMERLLADAEKLDSTYKAARETNGKYALSFNDIVTAIEIVQKKQNIAGTTQREAAATLQGSINMTKAAWQNFITGLSDGNADVKQLMDDLLKSVETVGANLFPIVERSIDSIVKLLGDAIPKILKDLPDKLDEYAPKILDAAEKITNGLLDVLPEFLDRIPKILEESLPKVMSAAKKLFKIIIQALPTLIKAFGEALSETLPIIIPELTNALKEIINVLTDPQFIKMLIDLTLQLITTVTNSLSDSLPDIINSIVNGLLTIINELTNPEVLKSLVKAATKLIIALTQGLIEALPQIIDALPELVENILTGLLESAPEIAEAGVQLFGLLVSNIPGIQARVVQAIPQIIAAIFSSFASFGYDLGQKFYEAWEYVKEVFSPENVQQFFAEVWNNIQQAFSGVGEFFQDLWYEITEIFSPVGEWFGNLFNDAWDNIQQAFANVGGFFQGIWNNIKNAFSGVANWFSNTFKAAWEGVKAVFSAGGRIFNGIKDGILNGFKVVVNGIIDGINTVVAVPFNGINTALRSIRGVEIAGFKPFDWIQEITVPQIPRLAEGGVLKRGQIALLEGEGAEAVIPLEKNTEWIDMIASRLNKKSEPQNIYYNVNVEVANMNANNQDEIETLADKLMSIMAEKSMRREVAFG